MRRILLRSTMPQINSFTDYEVMSQNLIGNNIGNMLFPFSLYNTLIDGDTTIDTSNSFKEEDAERINEEYDLFVIALANAFRSDFIGKLNELTGLVKKLTIPCVVVGVGMQAGFDPDFSGWHDYDEPAKAFCEAVLEKSASIGVRGRFTKQYIAGLGIPEERIDIIGCPSMYLWGDRIPVATTKKELTSETRMSINLHGNFPVFHGFLESIMKEHPDYYIVPQERTEMQLIYAGKPLGAGRVCPEGYPNSMSNAHVMADRLRSFTDVPSWLDYFKERDLTVGSRIHGNVAGILGGCQPVLFAADARVRELAEYHEIPFFPVSAVKEGDTLEQYYAQCDYTAMVENHPKRFAAFVAFLQRNQIRSIYDEGCPEVTPFFRLLEEEPKRGAMKTLYGIGGEELAERMNNTWADYDKLLFSRNWNRNKYREFEKKYLDADAKTRELNAKTRELNAKTRELSAKIKELEAKNKELGKKYDKLKAEEKSPRKNFKKLVKSVVNKL